MVDEKSFSCAACGGSFASQEALQMHSSAKHAPLPASQPLVRLPSANKLIALLVVAGLVAGGAWFFTQPRELRLPTTQDHWHAGFELKICGQRQPDLPYSQGDVHTHGDGKIHVHPHSVATAGRNANIAAFFSSAGLSVSGSSLKLPDGRVFNAGDACADGRTGAVKVTVNGAVLQDFGGHVMQDGDFVRVEFG